MTVNRSDFQKQSLSGVTPGDKFLVLDEGGTDEPGVVTASALAASAPFNDAYIPKSTLTTDGDVLTRAAGVPARITRADLAQDTAFSSRYKPISGDRIWVPATAIGPRGGSPTLGAVDTGAGQLAWLLDASTDEGLNTSVAMPSTWTTFVVDLYWTNAGAGAGNVKWYMDSAFAGDTETSDATNGSSGFNTAVTAPSRSVVKVTRIQTSTTNQANDLFFIRLFRSATDAADTLGNDCGVFGLMFLRNT